MNICAALKKTHTGIPKHPSWVLPAITLIFWLFLDAMVSRFIFRRRLPNSEE